MKTAIIGFSGSGKSTLAQKIGKLDRAEVLHLDTVHFLPNWIVREREEKEKIVEDFLNSRDSWVIDGNYTKLSYERRMEEADRIVMLLFNRFTCLRRVIKRYRQYKNTTRPDMTEGCPEKLDREFVLWVLFGGRKRAAKKRYKKLRERYPEKTVVLRNQKELDAFWEAISSGEEERKNR